MQRRIWLIAGPTASGKSALALKLARARDGEIVNADSMQLYRDLRVLTARWLGLPPGAGRLFKLGTGTLSTLGTEHGDPVISSWNVPG